MLPFSFVEPDTPAAALQAAAEPGTSFFAGGTTLIDLMKIDVMAPTRLVDINRLSFSAITEGPEGITIGANVRNSDLAHNPIVRERFPVLAQALLAGASAQIRNMATTAGNLLQRTRCPYFRDVHSACNRRAPGSGCDALTGFNRSHAVLGTSDHCIATHPSDMCVALMILDATVATQRVDGRTRQIPLNDFYLLPGDTPQRENMLEPGELITHVHLTHSDWAKRSCYLKVRDRASYDFALASAAVAIETHDSIIANARVALGGVGTIPWRAREAEAVLKNKSATRETFQAAAEAALAGARPQRHNGFKVPLAKATLIMALEQLIERRYEGSAK